MNVVRGACVSLSVSALRLRALLAEMHSVAGELDGSGLVEIHLEKCVCVCHFENDNYILTPE